MSNNNTYLNDCIYEVCLSSLHTLFIWTSISIYYLRFYFHFAESANSHSHAHTLMDACTHAFTRTLVSILLYLWDWARWTRFIRRHIISDSIRIVFNANQLYFHHFRFMQPKCFFFTIIILKETSCNKLHNNLYFNEIIHSLCHCEVI